MPCVPAVGEQPDSEGQFAALGEVTDLVEASWQAPQRGEQLKQVVRQVTGRHSRSGQP